jgi:hypothetical protein
MDPQRLRDIDRLDIGMVGDLYRRVLELIVVERVFLFSSHTTPPLNCLKGGVYFFGAGSVRVDGVVRLLHEALPWLMIRLESKNALTTIRDLVQPKYRASPNR